MLHQKLTKLLHELDDFLIMDTPTTFEEEHHDYKQLQQDLHTVLNLDRTCRMSMEPIDEITKRIEIPHATYLVFFYTTKRVLEYVENHCISVKASVAYTTIQGLLYSDVQFTLQELFTITSIVITMVALCMNDIPSSAQTAVVHHLDQLLNVKLQQLKLLNEMVNTEDSSVWIS